MEVLAVIPARGGSKSIPKKNIKILAGRPLIAWSIEEAKKSKFITRLVVSTDDPEIANLASALGAEVPFLRPEKISGDLSTDVEFLEHALNFLRVKENYKPDIVIRLPPTSPLREARHIDKGIETLLSIPEADSVRPITKAPKHPYKMWKISEDVRFMEPFLSKSITKMDEPYNAPRQLLPEVYVHTGAMDVMCLQTILKRHSTSGEKVAYFFMEPECSVNIDEPIDFDLAELLLNKKLNSNDSIYGRE